MTFFCVSKPLQKKKQILVLFNFKILVSASVKDKSLNPYTIYLCMYLCKVCVCVCVCDERGGSMSAAVKVKSLNPFAEGELNQ